MNEVRTESAAPVLWFTGLSGAGKTTTARVVKRMLTKAGYAVQLLDGDELRRTICSGLGFSRADRMENVKRIAYVAELLSRHGIVVLVSAIAPYKEMRAWARSYLSHYVEVYVQCPLAECERRDVKGLYAKARNGEIPKFTGISDPYDVPEKPELTLDTFGRSVEENAVQVMKYLQQIKTVRLDLPERVSR